MTTRAPVAAAEAVRVRIPLRSPFVTSVGSWTEHDAWIVRWRDEEGLEGLGEACLDPAATTAEVDRLAGLIPPVVASLVGREVPTAREDPTGPLTRADGDAVVLALRAALAASSDERDDRRSTRSTVAVNATIATEGAEASVAAAVEAVAAGFRTLKLKGGSEPATAPLVERMAAVRSAVGAGIALRLDVNGAWDPPTAAERLAALAGLDLEYVEDPLGGTDPGALARLRAGSPVPIALDQAVTSPTAARVLVAANAADVLVVKPTRVGGPPAALVIAEAAGAAGVSTVVSTLLETGIGLVAALRTAARLPSVARAGGEAAHGLATGALLEHDLLLSPLAPVQGRLEVPVGPGLGVSVDEVALDRFAVDRIGSGAPWR